MSTEPTPADCLRAETALLKDAFRETREMVDMVIDSVASEAALIAGLAKLPMRISSLERRLEQVENSLGRHIEAS